MTPSSPASDTVNLSPSTVRFFLATPHPGASGAAISIIHLDARTPADLDDLLRRIGIADLPPNRVGLRSIAGIDTGLVARWTPTVAHLMPHGGNVIIQRILETLESLGASAYPAPHAGPSDQPMSRYPEAVDLIEACALEAMAHAVSPLAIDAILRQRDLWRRPVPLVFDADARLLGHLLVPPTIVLLGAPNIGKSTLTNALARRQVSIVADQPGTTRDHVGVMLDLAGLVVRWIDAPGINPESSDPIERAAIDLTLVAVRQADLILIGADPTRDPPTVSLPAVPVLRVALRTDLGSPKGITADVVTSAHANQGITELTHAVREVLIPARLLATPSRWRFHPALP
ncbi:MAG: 50S ribosome-binding GTPase [Phycisphaerae bacterium]|nr:50S ribosome-binding GTPase [Phycisphaerae bacterium]